MNFARMIRYMQSVGDTSTEMYFINGETVDIGSENADIQDKFIPFTDEYSNVFMDATFLVLINHTFFFAEELSNLKSLRGLNSKICFITMHPSNCSWFVNNQLMNPQKDIPNFFGKIKKNNAFTFMDEANRVAANLISGLEFNKNYFPTSYDVFEEETEIPPVHEGVNIGWFGRIDIEKIASVINMLDNIYDYCINNNVIMTVYIIGDGNGRHMIKVGSYSPYLRIVFTSYLYGDAKKEFISKKLDAIVAMGISSIDAAVLGIPTVIPIVSDQRFVSNRFVYIKDVIGYSLAWTREVLRYMDMPIITMSDIITDLLEGKKEQIGKECRKFVIDNFNAGHCTALFKESTSHTTYYISDLLKTPVVKRTLKDYKKYKFITKRNDINIYFMFLRRKKRVFKEHGIPRIQALYNELNKTRNNKKRNNNEGEANK